MSVNNTALAKRKAAEDITQMLRTIHAVLSGRYSQYRREWLTVDAYRFHIFQVHQYVQHTIPVLESLVSTCTDAHRNWLVAHIEEERGHDRLFETDLCLTGGYPSWEVSPAVKNYIYSSQLLASSNDPFSAVLADMLLAEGNAPSRFSVLEWANLTGIDVAAFSGLLAHADADGGHREQILRIVSSHDVDLGVTAERLVQVANYFMEHWKWMCVNGSLAGTIEKYYDNY